jgi:hypothetical protein
VTNTIIHANRTVPFRCRKEGRRDRVCAPRVITRRRCEKLTAVRCHRPVVPDAVYCALQVFRSVAHSPVREHQALANIKRERSGSQLFGGMNGDERSTVITPAATVTPNP